ncbi:BRD4-interacting chromatin-remodeling complex-associated protein [Eudromia elegans]
MDDEDGRCLLDVICDPQALNDFLHGSEKVGSDDLLDSTGDAASAFFEGAGLPGQESSGSALSAEQSQPAGAVDLDFLDDAILGSPGAGAEQPCDILQQSLQEANITEQTLEAEAELALGSFPLPALQPAVPPAPDVFPAGADLLGLPPPAVLAPQALVPQPVGADVVNKAISVQPFLQHVGIGNVTIQPLPGLQGLPNGSPGAAAAAAALGIGPIQVVGQQVMAINQPPQQLLAKQVGPAGGRGGAVTGPGCRRVTAVSAALSPQSAGLVIQKNLPAVATTALNGSPVFGGVAGAPPPQPLAVASSLSSPLVPAQNVIIHRTPTPIQPKPAGVLQQKLYQLTPKPFGAPGAALAVPGEAALQQQQPQPPQQQPQPPQPKAPQQNLTFKAGQNVVLSGFPPALPANVFKPPAPQPAQPPAPALGKPMSVQLLNQGGSIVIPAQHVPQAVNQFLLPPQLSALPANVGGQLLAASHAAAAAPAHIIASQGAGAQLIANPALPAQLLANQNLAGQLNLGPVLASPNAPGTAHILSAPIQVGRPALLRVPAPVPPPGPALIRSIPLPTQVMLNAPDALNPSPPAQPSPGLAASPDKIILGAAPAAAVLGQDSMQMFLQQLPAGQQKLPGASPSHALPPPPPPPPPPPAAAAAALGETPPVPPAPLQSPPPPRPPSQPQPLSRPPSRPLSRPPSEPLARPCTPLPPEPPHAAASPHFQLQFPAKPPTPSPALQLPAEPPRSFPMLPSQFQTLPAIANPPKAGVISSVSGLSLGKGPLQIQVVGKSLSQLLPAVPVPAPQLYDGKLGSLKKGPTLQPSKEACFLEQLHKQQGAVLHPDYKAPFRSFEDALQRLLPYHVYQGAPPSARDCRKVDEEFEVVSAQLLKRTQAMLNKYRLLLLEESRRVSPSAEMVMIDRMFIQEEKTRLALDKQLAKEKPDEYVSATRPPTAAAAPAAPAPSEGPRAAPPPPVPPLNPTKLVIKHSGGSPSVTWAKAAPDGGGGSGGNGDEDALPSRSRPPMKTYEARSRIGLKLKIKQEAGLSKVVHNTALDPVHQAPRGAAHLNGTLEHPPGAAKRSPGTYCRLPLRKSYREPAEAAAGGAGGPPPPRAAHRDEGARSVIMAAHRSRGSPPGKGRADEGPKAAPAAAPAPGRSGAPADSAGGLMKELAEAEDEFYRGMIKAEPPDGAAAAALAWEPVPPAPKRRKPASPDVDNASFSSDSPQDDALHEHLQSAIDSILNLQQPPAPPPPPAPAPARAASPAPFPPAPPRRTDARLAPNHNGALGARTLNR